jgi:hypothetical protein
MTLREAVTILDALIGRRKYRAEGLGMGSVEDSSSYHIHVRRLSRTDNEPEILKLESPADWPPET